MDDWGMGEEGGAERVARLMLSSSTLPGLGEGGKISNSDTKTRQVGGCTACDWHLSRGCGWEGEEGSCEHRQRPDHTMNKLASRHATVASESSAGQVLQESQQREHKCAVGWLRPHGQTFICRRGQDGLAPWR